MIVQKLQYNGYIVYLFGFSMIKLQYNGYIVYLFGFSMMALVVHLLMRNDTGADKVLEFLLYNATATRGLYFLFEA